MIIYSSFDVWPSLCFFCQASAVGVSCFSCTMHSKCIICEFQFLVFKVGSLTYKDTREVISVESFQRFRFAITLHLLSWSFFFASQRWNLTVISLSASLSSLYKALNLVLIETRAVILYSYFVCLHILN